MASSLLCGIIAVCPSALFGQSFSQVRLVSLSAPAQLFSWPGTPAILNGFEFPAKAMGLLATKSFRSTTLSFETYPESGDCKRGLGNLFEFADTPFLQQVQMPLGSLFGGRINLGGFNAVTPMENIQRGLIGGGRLDERAAIPMGRGGMILPKDENRYGLSLTFNYSGNVDYVRSAKLNELITWLAEEYPVTWPVWSNPRWYWRGR